MTIKKVINDFQRELPKADIYVYDNNSTDETYQIALDEGAIVRKEPRQGKGNVIRQMFFDIEADYYLMVDGDDTYPAEACHDLLHALKEKRADMVIGDRLSNGTYFNENKRAFHDFGNALDKRFKLVEIPIDYRDRPEGSESKLDTFSDGTKVLMTIFKMCKDYKPLFFFTMWFALFFILGLLVGIPVISEYVRTGFIDKIPSAILATGLMTFSMLLLVTGFILDTVVTDNKKNYELNLYGIYDKANEK